MLRSANFGASVTDCPIVDLRRIESKHSSRHPPRKVAAQVDDEPDSSESTGRLRLSESLLALGERAVAMPTVFDVNTRDGDDGLAPRCAEFATLATARRTATWCTNRTNLKWVATESKLE